MKQEEAKKVSEDAIEALIAQVRAGKSDQLRAYLRAMAMFHDYSFGNILMIMIQKPDATNIAGFSTWKKLGRHVKRGEKGIAIFAPVVSRKKNSQDYGPSQESGEDEQRIRGFRVVHVFDVMQTEGECLPELIMPSGSVRGYLARIRSLVTQHGIALEYGTLSGGAYGSSSGGRIQVRQGLTEAEEFSVIAHELAHELLHWGDRRGDTTKTIRETEAEAVAFVVRTAIGFAPDSFSSDYIQLYSGKPEDLMQSLDYIRTTAGSIIKALMSDDGGLAE